MKKLDVLLFSCLLLIFSTVVQAQKAVEKTVPLEIGATAPDFTLSDQNGNSITLSEAKKPVVLVFYRGYW